MSCDPKVVMTIEIGEDGQVISVKGAENKKVKVLEDANCDLNVGTITKFVPLTVMYAHKSPDCWYLHAGRWYQIC